MTETTLFCVHQAWQQIIKAAKLQPDLKVQSLIVFIVKSCLCM